MRRFESQPLTARWVPGTAGGLSAAVPHPSLPGSRRGCKHCSSTPGGRPGSTPSTTGRCRPARSEELDRLPVVTKPALLARFDDWVTDPAVTRVGVEQFVANLDNLGREFLGRYVVFATSGSTGVPALLVQDQRAVAVMTGLTYARSLSALTPKLGAKMLTRPLGWPQSLHKAATS
jgi:hypothetical protein